MKESELITTGFGLVASNDFDTVKEKESLHPANHKA